MSTNDNSVFNILKNLLKNVGVFLLTSTNSWVDGSTKMGTWVQEKRDVLLDYKQLFGQGDKNPVVTGIAILTDPDNTNSHAIGDYDDIQAFSIGEGKLGRP